MKSHIYCLFASAILSLGLIAGATADETEQCWIEMERTMLGTALESGSFLFYTEEGDLDRASYHNLPIQQSEPEPGVFVVEWDFPELNESGFNRFNVRERQFVTTVFSEDVIGMDEMACRKTGEGIYSAVRRFTGSIGGSTYDVQDATFVMGQIQHHVRSVRTAGTNEVFGPVAVYFATKQPQ